VRSCAAQYIVLLLAFSAQRRAFEAAPDSGDAVLARIYCKGGDHMKRSTVVLGLVALAASWTVLADPPKTLHVEQTVDIKAPASKVWAAVKNFDSLPSWHPAFAKDEIVKGTNNQVGAERQLTVKDGPTFTERLLKFSSKNLSFHYQIVDPSPLPIVHYRSTMSVKAGADGSSSVVTWSGSFKRKNPADSPPDAESDAGVTKFITGVYTSGLDNLKKTVEGGG
jgi:mxaD protein